MESKAYHRGFYKGYEAFAEQPIFGSILRLAAKKALRHVNERDNCLQDKLDFERGFIAGATEAANDDGWKNSNDMLQTA